MTSDYYPRSFWRTVDWTRSNEEIAKATNRAVSTFATYRPCYSRSASSAISWIEVDWSKTNEEIAEELRSRPRHVRNQR